MTAIFRRIMVAVLLVAVLSGLGAWNITGRALAGGVLGPNAMLTAYYSALNARDYTTAYNQWVAPQQTYADFVAGYGTTSSIDAIFGGFQPGVVNSTQGYVTAFLTGYHYDGHIETYKGCYQVQYNPTESGIRSWLISGADIWAVPYAAGSQYSQDMNFDCLNRRTAYGGYLSVHGLLADYYSSINVRDFVRAYNMWSTPQQTYAQFVDGFATTSEVVMFTGDYQWGGNPAALQAGAVPVVLLGYHTDGSVVGYAGCFQLSFNANTAARWGILGANLRALTFVPPDLATVYTALSQSCY